MTQLCQRYYGSAFDSMANYCLISAGVSLLEQMYAAVN